MGADRQNPNTIFAVLGVVAVALLAALMTAWSYVGVGMGYHRSPTSSFQVSSQSLSGRGSVPETQQSGDTEAAGESGDQEHQESQNPVDPGVPGTPDVPAASMPADVSDNRIRSIYIIQPGDTLSGISAATGVSVDKLARANDIADVNLIYAGSALVIPVS